MSNEQCMAGLPPTRELIGLKIPYGNFWDENGHKLCYIKRRLITKYWLDGWDFCTYRPNFPGQPKYKERDMYGKSVYPFSFLQIHPLKCKYEYCVHEEDLEGMDTKLEAMHGWLGSMTVCCTPMLRYGRWSMEFHRPSSGDPEINIDQSKNLLEVERGNDLLAALCIAYAFDKALCQPLVTIIGYQEKEHPDDDDDSIGDEEPPQRNYPMLMAPPEEDDYDDNEEEFRPAGYLGYEDPEAQEEASEVSGYLEADPYAEDDDDDDDASEEYDENDEDDPETTGYLEDDGFQDEPGRR